MTSALETNEKASRSQDLQQKSHQRDKHLGTSCTKIFGSILKMFAADTEANKLKDKKVDDD